MKYALINTDRVDTVSRYLPANYDAVPFGPFVLVYGTDNRGWTLEEYVLPRLASGLFYPVPEDQAHTDLQVDDLGKVWDLTWLECIECFEYSTRPKRKYLGLEVEMWPDYTPDEDEPDPNPYRERGLSQSDF